VLATAQQDGISIPGSAAIPSSLLRTPVVGLHCEKLPAISVGTLTTALRGMAQRRLGTAEQVYNDLFIPSVRSLRDAYNEYVLAQVRLVDAIRSIPEQQSQAWTTYLQRLAPAGIAPRRIPRREWPSIVAEVQAMGVPVPADWNPADRATFMKASASALRSHADSIYSDFVTQHFRANLPTGLDWDTFCSEPTIQNRWLAMIHAPTGVSLSPGMGFEAFSRNIYEPQLQSVFLPRLDNLRGPPATFSPTGKLAAAGEAASAWAIAPATLLYMIVLCVLWHTGRLVYLGCRILLPAVRGPTRGIVQTCLIVLVVIPLAWLPADPPLLWVIGSGLRNTVLLGYDFGYDPAAGKPRSLASLLVPGLTTP
jgi:hypothetical protein